MNIQKLGLILSIFVCSLQVAIGQSPDKFNFQAVVRDGSGELVIQTQIALKISILQGSSTGTAVYEETHTPTTNENGLISLAVGTGTVLSGTFASIDWGDGPYFLKREVDLDGGTAYSISGTTEMMSVPYALYAESTGSSGATSLNGLSDVTVYGATGEESITLGHTTTGNSPTGANYNFAAIVDALSNITSGDWNVAIGHEALDSMDAGIENIAIGRGVMKDAHGVSTKQNVAIGRYALRSPGSAAAENVAIGNSAALLYTGSNSIAIGSSALYSEGDGGGNIAIGKGALYASGDADPAQSNEYNVAVGYEALYYNNPQTSDAGANKNVAIGYRAGYGNRSTFTTNGSSFNTFVGAETGEQSTTSKDVTNTTLLGYGAQPRYEILSPGLPRKATHQIVLGNLDIANVYSAGVLTLGKGDSTVSYPNLRGTTGQVLTLDGSGVASWQDAGGGGATDLDGLSDAKSQGTDFTGSLIVGHETTGTLSDALNNTALGINALRSISSGDNNTAIGFDALKSVGTGSRNAALGSGTLSSNTTGNGNVAIGYNSLFSVNDQSGNIAIGDRAGFALKTGGSNVHIGSFSGGGQPNINTDGSQNVGVGSYTLSGFSGSKGATNNTAVGYYALKDVGEAGTSTDSSDYNVGIGANSGRSVGRGSKYTVLGAAAGYETTYGTGGLRGTNVTLLGYNAEPSSATVSNEITLGDNTITALRCNTQTITSLSDRRDKKNIRTISEGLEFVQKLQPVTFIWNQRDGGRVDIPAAGFIAQDLLELQEASEIGEYLDLVATNNPDKLEARYNNLLPILVKAIQDQQELIDQQRLEINQLRAQSNEQENLLKEYESALINNTQLLNDIKTQLSQVMAVDQAQNHDSSH